MQRELFRSTRLIGRHLRLSDVDALLAVYGDAEAMRWVGDGTLSCCFAWHADTPPATKHPHGAAAGLSAE
ncbi:hypothetical protein [Xanthomonas tesorieronis]|uniref:hypothetical protein n=1 Tax=Xanthomonas tesorieronis TaxID=3160839 RepID=UPI003517D0AE